MCFVRRIISSVRTRLLLLAAPALPALTNTALADSTTAGPPADMFIVFPMTNLKQAIQDAATPGDLFEVHVGVVFDGWEPGVSGDFQSNRQTVFPASSVSDGKPIGRSDGITKVVPEPATWALLLLGSWGLLHRKRIRR